MKLPKTCNPFPAAGHVSFQTPALAALAIQHWLHDHQYVIQSNAQWPDNLWNDDKITALCFYPLSKHLHWFNNQKQTLHVNNLNDLKRLLWGPVVKVMTIDRMEVIIDPNTNQVSFESGDNLVTVSFDQWQTISKVMQQDD